MKVKVAAVVQPSADSSKEKATTAGGQRAIASVAEKKRLRMLSKNR